MYCAPSDVLSTTSGQHVVPMWPSAYAGGVQPSTNKGQSKQGVDKFLLGVSNVAAPLALPSLQYAWMPAHIAHGLLESVSFDQILPVDKATKDCKTSQTGKHLLGPQEQELHQQMLQKLALHLAAQPDAQPAAPQAGATQQESLSKPEPLQMPEPQATSPLHSVDVLTESKNVIEDAVHNENAKWAKELKEFMEDKRAKEGKGKNLSPQEQEFQQEMLRKLALHLAAQAELESEEQPEEGSLDSASCPREVTSPDVFPATPSVYGDDQCEHFFIGDDQGDQAADDTCIDQSADDVCHCWPSSSQCVWVPIHVAYGLLDGIAPEPDASGSKQLKGSKQLPNVFVPQEQEFHQQMLQKLALHLAAQPEPLQTSPATLPIQEDEPQASRSKSKVSWADVTDDVEMPQQPIGLEKAAKHCSFKGHKSNQSDEAKGKNIFFNYPPNKPEQQDFQQDMLRKLALHLAAQPEPEKVLEEATLVSLSEAKAIGDNKVRCDHLIAELEASKDISKSARAAKIMEWVLPVGRTLALTQSGSRVVQKVIDVASTKQREQLLHVLLEDVTELYTSPHANHVIAKLVEIMPPKNLTNIGESMRGQATTVARHQFGSRILERLVEHCGEDQIGFLLDEVVEDFEALARHQFGNFVVARLLEHSTVARKHCCVQKLLPHVLQHATHKTACNIVQRMLDHADLACQAMIADAFLAGSGETSLESIAATRYGSFVIQHLVDRFHPRIDAVKARLKAAHSQLQESGFSQRKIVQFLGEAFFRD